MKALRIPEVEIPIWWTAWEFPDEPTSGAAHRATFQWVKKKPSRSASVWRLADVEKTHWFVVAISEHRLVMEALERRLQRAVKTSGGEWYEIPEEDLIALVTRRVQDTLDALRSGNERDLTRERHFKGRYRLRSDGTLESVDRPQG